MADYYPLIARAVSGLEKNTGDARRLVYERSRTALVAQLRSVTPALSESDVTRERLALEEAVRKVEAECARQSWGEQSGRAEARLDVRPEPPSNKVRAPEMPRWEDSLLPTFQEGQRRTPPPSTPPQVRPEPTARRQSIQPASRTAKAPNGMFGDDRQVDRHVDPILDRPAGGASLGAPPALTSPPRHPLRGRPPGERNSLLNSGLNDFRNDVSKAGDFDEMPAPLSKMSRELSRDLSREAPREPYGNSLPAVRDFDQNRPPYESRGDDEMLQDVPPPEMLEPSFGMDEARPLSNRNRMPPRVRDDDRTDLGSGRSYREWIKAAAALLIVVGLGGALVWLWPSMASLYGSLRGPATVEVSGTSEAPVTVTRPKISDRFEPGGGVPQQNVTLTPGTAQGGSQAQRVVLYEEDPADPQGKRFVGSAIWRTETISPGPGMAPELAIRADVEIPERKLTMTWSLRRNADPGLPASHTVEITFRLPADFVSGGVSNVPGILMKEAEQSRGVPLAGLAVKVTNGFFLIGLSSVDADKERNVSLLKQRSWFDIPVVYNNNRRAILALEKGSPGERAFAEAFTAWRQ